ncbi:MAG: hypothetical protein M1490_00935 [Candidatus Bathyarchaeota archaeon]|nr:hypothetical protein [Candidatus Bathyarchaeota archaeon]
MNNFKELLDQKVVFHNCFGIYITTKSFSKPANTSAQKGIDKGLVIIRIDKSNMTALIEKGFRRYTEDAFDEFLAKA